MQLADVRVRAQRAGTPRRGAGSGDAQAIVWSCGEGVVTGAFVRGVVEVGAVPAAGWEHGAAEGAAGGFFVGVAETAGEGEAAAGEDEEAVEEDEEDEEEEEEEEGAEDEAD